MVDCKAGVLQGYRKTRIQRDEEGSITAGIRGLIICVEQSSAFTHAVSHFASLKYPQNTNSALQEPVFGVKHL